MSTVWGDYYPGTNSRDPSHYGSPGLSNRTPFGDCSAQWPKHDRTATEPSGTGLEEWHSHYTDLVEGRNLWVGGSWGLQISHYELPGHLCYPWIILSIAADKLDLMAEASTFTTGCCCKLQPPATQHALKAHVPWRSWSQPLLQSEGGEANQLLLKAAPSGT